MMFWSKKLSKKLTYTDTYYEKVDGLVARVIGYGGGNGPSEFEDYYCIVNLGSNNGVCNNYVFSKKVPGKEVFDNGELLGVIENNLVTRLYISGIYPKFSVCCMRAPYYSGFSSGYSMDISNKMINVVSIGDEFEVFIEKTIEKEISSLNG